MLQRTKLSAAAALAVSGLAPIALPSLAQQQLGRVEITGSAIKRIESETSLPVTIVTREEIQKSGATTAAELLDRLSVSNGQGYNQSLGIGDIARPGLSGGSLRGLGANTTLVLLNGRRLAAFAFDGGAVDLNSIAIGAIERVEVLRDGASALYGTDAIAGVINFITRRDFRGLDVNVSAYAPRKSGSKSHHAAVTGGIGDITSDKFNLFANLTYDKSDALQALERDFSKTSFLPDAPGGIFDRTSGVTIPASIVVPGVGTVNPGVPNCQPPASFQTSPTGACRFDYASVIDILPPQEKTGGLVRGTLQLTPSHEAFVEYNRTRTISAFAVSPVPASSAATFNGDPVLYPAGGRWYPQAINPATGALENGVLWYAPDGTLTNFVPLSGDLDLAWRTLDAGPRTNRSTATQDRFVIGAKGNIFGAWDYDTAFLHAQSKVNEDYVNGCLSETRLLNSTCTDVATGAAVTAGCGPAVDPATTTYTVGTINPDINPFGPNDATGLAALRSALILAPTRISKSTRDSVDAKVSGELAKLPAGPLAVAFGAERRKEKLNDQVLPVLSSGDVLGSGGNQQSVQQSRSVSAVFGEVVAPITKGLELLAQVRHDRYSDFGGTTNPKLGLRWQPADSVLVRASVGTGFRAPTLPDLYAGQVQTSSGNNFNDPFYEARVGDCYDAAGNPTVNFTPQFCNVQVDVLQGGNRNLEPEESRQHSVGLVLQPTRDSSVSIDYWNIEIKKQITQTDPDAILAGFIGQFLADPSAAYDPTTSKLSAAGRAAIAGGAGSPSLRVDAGTGFLDAILAPLSNLDKTEASGIDVSLRALIAKTSFGEFRGGLDTTYIISYKKNGEEFVARYQGSTNNNAGPVVRVRNALSLGWTFGPWDTTAFYRWQSGYSDVGDTRRVGSYELVDLAFAFSGIKNLTLRAGIQNLFDRIPPYTRTADYFQVAFDPTYADPRGRAFTVGVSYLFN